MVEGKNRKVLALVNRGWIPLSNPNIQGVFTDFLSCFDELLIW